MFTYIFHINWLSIYIYIAGIVPSTAFCPKFLHHPFKRFYKGLAFFFLKTQIVTALSGHSRERTGLFSHSIFTRWPIESIGSLWHLMESVRRFRSHPGSNGVEKTRGWVEGNVKRNRNNHKKSPCFFLSRIGVKRIIRGLAYVVIF